MAVTVATLLEEVARHGGHVDLVDGRPRLCAPPGFPDDVRAKARELRDELIATLSTPMVGADSAREVAGSVPLPSRPAEASPVFVQNDQAALSTLHNGRSLPGFDPIADTPPTHWRAVADVDPAAGLVGLVGQAAAGELLAASHRWERARYVEKQAAADAYSGAWARASGRGGR